MATYWEWHYAAKQVIQELARYDGECIVAHEHPLHLAIQNIEKLTIVQEHKFQKARLCGCLVEMWNRLLDLSRDIAEPRTWHDNEYVTEASTAKEVATILRHMMMGAADAMALLALTKGVLPKECSRSLEARNGTTSIPADAALP